MRRGRKKGDPQIAFLLHWMIDRRQAALSHMAVSKALLMSGMFMPKLAFAAFFEALAGFSVTFWATSARSHCPCSWERATEKNRNT